MVPQRKGRRMNATESYDAAIAAMGLTMKADFVPFSKSRNAKEKSPSLNWIVTISNGRGQSITVDYTQGIGHAPSYKSSLKSLGNRNSMARHEAMTFEAESGRKYTGYRFGGKPLPPPTIADVLSSLVLDAGAIDHPSFESWAGDYGYDIDSRKGEAAYRSCLEIGLKLRAMVGEKGLAELAELLSNY